MGLTWERELRHGAHMAYPYRATLALVLGLSDVAFVVGLTGLWNWATGLGARLALLFCVVIVGVLAEVVFVSWAAREYVQIARDAQHGAPLLPRFGRHHEQRR